MTAAINRTLRRHIDYLLAGRGVRIRNIVRSGQAECRLNQAVKGTVRVPGFGASDYLPVVRGQREEW